VKFECGVDGDSVVVVVVVVVVVNA